MNWYYAVDRQRHGPFSQDEFVRIVGTGVITDATLVWREGLPQWRAFADLKGELGVAPPAGGVPTVAAQPTAPAAPVKFEFTGTGGEYFKIWIVNLLLTIVTVGIYAAWAKVRNRRYFYANTRVFGHAFDYTGNPVRILIGNLIVLGMAVVYFTSGAVSPILMFGAFILFTILTPWLIVKSLSFNARNSTFRGLRFGFDGTYGGAARVYLLLPVGVALTLYALLPWVMKEQKKFVVENHRYGATPFGFHGSALALYKIAGMTLLFFLPLLAVYFGLFAVSVAEGLSQQPGAPGPAASGAVVLLSLVMIPAAIVATLGTYYFRARLFNYVWGNTTLGNHRFDAGMTFSGFLGLQVVNVLAIVFTAGLLYPWAKVRTVRYMLDNLQFVPGGSIDDLASAGAAADESAVGESASDFFDFDIGLGV